MLDAAAIAKRLDYVTATDIPVLMSGTAVQLMDKWREKTGDPTWKPKDLTWAWPIRRGNATETLNLNWFEHTDGMTVSRRGEFVVHPEVPWAACTLDGFVAAIPGPIDAKDVGGREARSTVVERYIPSTMWQMMVTQTEMGILSIIEGGNEPVIERIPFDQDYADQIWERAHAFWRCVQTLTPPVILPPVPPPVEAKKIVDMTGNNAWAVDATRWLENVAGKRTAEAAEKAIKALVPDDAARCWGHGVQVNRDKAGRLSLRELT